MKILTILGARPQFIKAAAVSRAIRAHNAKIGRGNTSTRIEERIVHTGQHFDANMSDVFFEQLDIPEPDENLGIASLSHGAMTGRMLEKIEASIQNHPPDWVLVYGDTNSTLAGALAAVKLHVPIAHVEAGLRSHDPAMPEEINRVLTDRISNLLFCPTGTAVANLEREGFPHSATGGATQRIENVGDVMYDATLFYREMASHNTSLDTWNLNDQDYALCTLHRQENTDNPKRLPEILQALTEIARNLPVVILLHPRTRKVIAEQGLEGTLQPLKVLEPQPYLETQRLLMGARLVLTDSGGLQKEAFFHSVPCVTLRPQTEWTETVESGWNQLADASKEKITAAALNPTRPNDTNQYPYGNGKAAEEIVTCLLNA
ncbi:MAG: UDP-N-acetylglucosamine 2-epimerase (non-hydrolyzing) [Wenzhouxiangella sp.]|jgi:UDP-GlcNAc3NAcA epimerase|nr:UDP-N-acetylglucosamine 2-epimerase (non-hydrolyzing) [Wenzhouxiangella sp.]